MRKENPKSRICKAAFGLFYQNGYQATAINEILEKSASHKKSYYRYFRNREDLGKEYLKQKEQHYLNFILELSKKHNDFQIFWKFWVSFLKRDISRKDFNGCPIANFSIYNRRDFKIQIKSFIVAWDFVLFQYLQKSVYKDRKFNQSKIQEFSKKIMLLYEGALITYIMSNDNNFINYLHDEVLFLAERYIE